MTTRSLLPVAVLDDASPPSVDRILARGFWGDPPEVEGATVLRLERPEAERAERVRQKPAVRNR